MSNFEVVTKEDIKEYNPNYNPSRILKIKGSGTGKSNSLFNLVNQQQDIDKIYLYSKDPNEAKHKILIKDFKMLKAFIEYSNDMDYIYRNIEEFNPDKRHKRLFPFLLICLEIKSLIQ